MEAERRPASTAWIYFLVGLAVGAVVYRLIVPTRPRPMFQTESQVLVDSSGKVSPKNVGVTVGGPGPTAVHWVAPVGSTLRINISAQIPPNPPAAFPLNCNPQGKWPNECWSRPLTDANRAKTYVYQACVTINHKETCSDDPWIHVDP